MRSSFILILIVISSSLSAQLRIDSTFAFQIDPAKKYSLYIPSSYNPATPHRLMLGLHPFNTSRWWAESWCDTLIVFAETNGLILACPDGGTDGKIDDAIDTAFTSALLDSMKVWYNIDPEKTYVMGFSWGAQTTYTYGLRHISRFGGMLPIGSSMVTSVLVNADSVPVYIVHGGSDIPSSRYTPIRDALIANGAILNSVLMPGIGHTIDFPNRNQIITIAFQWIDSVNCSLLDTTTPPVAPVASFSWMDTGGGATTFTDSSSNMPDTWLWDFGDGNTSTEQNPLYTYPNIDSTYYVCLTASNSGGSGTFCDSITIADTTTGPGPTQVSEYSNLPWIYLYPNPSNGHFTIFMSDARVGIFTVKLFNAVGAIVYEDTKKLTSGEQELSIILNELPGGTYFLELNGRDLFWSRSILLD